MDSNKNILKVKNEIKILKILKPGSFGKIFLVYSNEFKENLIMKCENKKNNMLQKEFDYYNILKKSNITPKFFYFYNTVHYNIILLEKYGINLEKLMVQCENKHIPKDKILIISYGLFIILNKLHSFNIVYQDIKPENFLIKNYNNITFDNINDNLKIIDFGLSKRISDVDINTINKNHKFGCYIGTKRYCSRNAYRGYDQYFYDDIESLIYMIIYLNQGYLPWQNSIKKSSKFKISTKELFKNIDYIQIFKELYNHKIEYNKNIYNTVCDNLKKLNY